MFGLPTFAIVAIAIVAIAAVAGFYLYRRHRFQFRRLFAVDPKSGSEESVRGIVRAVLQRMVWELETLDGLLEYYNQRATAAIDTDTALGIHVNVDQASQEILRHNADLSRAVVVAGHFGHKDVVSELGLQQHLPSQGY